MKLDKKVFLALAAVAWSDGEMTEAEARTLLKAARAAGLDGPDLADVERATRSKDAAKQAPKTALSEKEAEFVYAVACLLSASDGAVAEEEREAIAALADRMKIPFDVRTRAAAASVAVGKSLELGEETLAALARELEGHR